MILDLLVVRKCLPRCRGSFRQTGRKGVPLQLAWCSPSPTPTSSKSGPTTEGLLEATVKSTTTGQPSLVTSLLLERSAVPEAVGYAGSHPLAWTLSISRGTAISSDLAVGSTSPPTLPSVTTTRRGLTATGPCFCAMFFLDASTIAQPMIRN